MAETMSGRCSFGADGDERQAFVQAMKALSNAVVTCLHGDKTLGVGEAAIVREPGAFKYEVTFVRGQ